MAVPLSRHAQDDLSTSVGHLVVAVAERIAVWVAGLGALVEVDIGAPLTRLSVDGGLAKRRALMQAVANAPARSRRMARG